MLRMFENGVLGNVFGPKVGDVIENWRKMHGEALHDFYCLPNIRTFRSMMMDGQGMRRVRGRGETHTLL
jgi:hypothetical protein